MSKKVDLPEEETYETVLKELVKECGVRGWIVINEDGIVIKSHGYSDSECIKYAGSIMSLANKSIHFLNQPFVQSIITENTNELQTIQLRTVKNEIIVAPHPKFTLICIYEPSYVEPQKEEGEDDDDFI